MLTKEKALRWLHWYQLCLIPLTKLFPLSSIDELVSLKQFFESRVRIQTPTQVIITLRSQKYYNHLLKIFILGVPNNTAIADSMVPVVTRVGPQQVLIIIDGKMFRLMLHLHFGREAPCHVRCRSPWGQLQPATHRHPLWASLWYPPKLWNASQWGLH